MNNDSGKVQPFESFTAVYKILVWAGYSNLLNKQTSRLKRISHQIYRYFVLIFIIVYNVQHIIFTVENLHNMDKLIDCLVIEIPQLNMLAKFVTTMVYKRRIHDVIEFLRGPLFASTDDEDELILRENVSQMHKLSKTLNVGVMIATVLWPCSYFFKRYNDPTEVVSSYVPFKTDTWPTFSLSVFLETGPVLWCGFGHLGSDCLIATYYAEVQTQLKMIKYQLKGLIETRDNNNNLQSNFEYSDATDKTLSRRFVQIVKRYEMAAWYKNEVDTIFNFALTMQFLTSASVVCLVIYKMTTMKVSSFPFMFLALLFILLLTQVFLYCFFGNLVEIESESVNESVYSSEWLSTSVSFRGSLLIAMCRWSKPLKPRVGGIIPLSLTTFITIMRSSYTLYTVLVVTAN